MVIGRSQRGGTTKIARAAFILGSLAASAAAAPNFVFILGEGMGWTSTSVRMDPDIPESRSEYFRTPNLQRLAEGGMRFANFYAPSPRCTPPRATYFTGKSPAKLGMTFVGIRAGSNVRLVEPTPTLEETTIAEVLRDSGYATAHFGKWHVGRRSPTEHGFGNTDGANNNGGPENVQSPNPKQAYAITERGLEFIESNAKAGRRFYLQISHYGGRGGTSALSSTNQAVLSWAESRGRSAREMAAAAVVLDMDITVGMVLVGRFQYNISMTRPQRSRPSCTSTCKRRGLRSAGRWSVRSAPATPVCSPLACRARSCWSASRRRTPPNSATSRVPA